MLIALSFAALNREKHSHIQHPSDGSRVELKAISSGQTIKVFHGELWQKVLYQVFGTFLPAKLRGFESAYSLQRHPGSIAVCFWRYIPKSPQIPFETAVTRVAASDERSTTNVGEIFRFSTVQGPTDFTVEEGIWILDRVNGPTLKLRYQRGENAAEFTIPNPMPL